MNLISLSEMVAHTPAIGSHAGRVKSAVTTDISALRYDDSWRMIPPDKQESLSMLGGLPDRKPFATNGVIFLALSGESIFIGQCTNLIKPFKHFTPCEPSKTPKTKTPVKASWRKTVLIDIDSLLA